jgi:hypothetical protein
MHLVNTVHTNMLKRVFDVTEDGRLGSSDHTVIVKKIAVGSVLEVEKGKMPNWNRTNCEAMRSETGVCSTDLQLDTSIKGLKQV